MKIKFKSHSIFRKTAIIIFLFLMVSCGSVMKVILGIPALKVYTQEEIQLHINTLPIAPNILDVQPKKTPTEEEIKNMVYESIMQKSYVFNKNKEPLCYEGDDSCTVNALKDLEAKKIQDVFKACEQPKDSLSPNADFNMLREKFDLSENAAMGYADYVVVSFWNTDMEKDEIAQNWERFQEFFPKEENVYFIRVWTDLNEAWGLNPDGKARFKNRKVTGEKKTYYLSLGELPYK